MYGTRGRIGLITLATDTSVLPEYARVMPNGVAVYPAPIVLPRGEVTAAALAEMLEGDQLERAAELLAWAEVKTIVFACTTGSLVHGIGWDLTLIARIERASGIPATTTTTAVLAALRAAGASSLAIATPYIEELNAIEQAFFSASGFAVDRIAGLRCATDAEIGRLVQNQTTSWGIVRRGGAQQAAPLPPTCAVPCPRWCPDAALGPDDAIGLVELIDSQRADAIFISCTNFHCLEAVDQLERQHQKPMITSNLAGAWAALRRIGIDDAVPGYGRLLTLPAFAEAAAS